MKVVSPQTESFEKYRKHQSQFLYLVRNDKCSPEWYSSLAMSAKHAQGCGSTPGLCNASPHSQSTPTKSETSGAGSPSDSEAGDFLSTFFPTEEKSPISRHKSLALSLTQASRGEVSEWLSPTAVSQENCPHHSTGCCGHASSVSEGVGALRPLGACPSCRQNTHQPLLARLELTKAGL